MTVDGSAKVHMSIFAKLDLNRQWSLWLGVLVVGSKHLEQSKVPQARNSPANETSMQFRMSAPTEWMLMLLNLQVFCRGMQRPARKRHRPVKPNLSRQEDCNSSRLHKSRCMPMLQIFGAMKLPHCVDPSQHRSDLVRFLLSYCQTLLRLRGSVRVEQPAPY